VQRQMILWPKPQDSVLETQIWQNIHPETQRVLITTLARLVAKALRPKSLADPQEVNHESK